MLLSDFDFSLPEDLIALRPAVPRSASRLLVCESGQITDDQFTNLADHLREGDLLVFNDTRVIPARLRGERHRDTPHGPGLAVIEVTLLGAFEDTWSALVKPAKRLIVGDVITFSDQLTAEVLSRNGGEVRLRFSLQAGEFEAALADVGSMPLPPYIASKRAVDGQDTQDYQTVFAKTPGAVAAPTASLHFDDSSFAALKTKGVDHTFLTLHVGAGTFLPVKTDDVSAHKMHAEWGQITQPSVDAILRTRQRGGRIIPVGTTALRLLESAATGPGQIAPWAGETDIFIKPGHEFLLTDALITNFHLPKSTLLMLVAALIGTRQVHDVYAHAIAKGYRFFSYGDSSLLIP